MGYFSWITQDTKRSIGGSESPLGTFSVMMTDNNGNKWHEDNYEGYGVFGGKDFYELLAEMNGMKTRDEGIDLFFEGEKFLCPNLTESKTHQWTNDIPKDCPNQGYFYDIEDDDDYCGYCGGEIEYSECIECGHEY